MEGWNDMGMVFGLKGGDMGIVFGMDRMIWAWCMGWMGRYGYAWDLATDEDVWATIHRRQRRRRVLARDRQDQRSDRRMV